MSANRQASYKTRLDSAVTAGTITQAQENLILAEQTSQQTFMASLKGMTQTQRQAAMKANQANLKAWATTNSIPQKFIPGGFGGRGMGGHRFGNASATPAATPAP